MSGISKNHLSFWHFKKQKHYNMLYCKFLEFSWDKGNLGWTFGIQTIRLRKVLFCANLPIQQSLEVHDRGANQGTRGWKYATEPDQQHSGSTSEAPLLIVGQFWSNIPHLFQISTVIAHIFNVFLINLLLLCHFFVVFIILVCK